MSAAGDGAPPRHAVDVALADVHGDRWARGAPHDHAVNVVGGGPPPWLRDALHAAVDHALAAYPDETEATRAIAARHGRRPDEVVLLNGAAHGFALLADALAPRRPVVVHPQFTDPDRALAAAGQPAAHVLLPPPFALDPEAIPDDADVVVVGNPTNPTGVLHPRAAIEELRRPGRTVVVDEAFMDFVAGDGASLARARDVPGLIVVRSLTKILGVPGLRIGYLLAEPVLAARLRDRRAQWPVGTAALVALREAARRREELDEIAARVRAARTALEQRLHAADVPGLRVHGAAAGFVLIAIPGGRAVADGLRAEHGIAVRPAHTFPGLTADHLRLTARGDPHDARLVAALEAVSARRLPSDTPQR